MSKKLLHAVGVREVFYIVLLAIFAISLISVMRDKLDFSIDVHSIVQVWDPIKKIDIPNYLASEVNPGTLVIYKSDNLKVNTSVLDNFTQRYLTTDLNADDNFRMVSDKDQLVINTILNQDTLVNIVYDDRDRTFNLTIPQKDFNISTDVFRTQPIIVGRIPLPVEAAGIVFENGRFITDDGKSNFKLIPYSEVDGPNTKFIKQNQVIRAGEWNANVSDCSAWMQGDPNISAQLISTTNLEITSANHDACVKNSINFQNFSNNNIYILDVKYKVLEGDGAAIHITTNSGATPIVQNLKPTSNWQNKYFLLNSEEGLSNIVFHVYAKSDGAAVSRNHYGNIFVYEYSLVTTSMPIINKLYKLSDFVQIYSGVDISGDPQGKTVKWIESESNLLAKFDPSFEESADSIKVENCSSWMDGEATDLIAATSSDSTDGESSVSLSSRNHFACINRVYEVDIDSDYVYNFKFDYKNIYGDLFKYNVKVGNNFNYGKELLTENKEWQTESFEFSLKSSEASKITVHFYAPAYDKLNTNLVDNLELTKVGPAGKDDAFVEIIKKTSDHFDTDAYIESSHENLFTTELNVKNVRKSFILSSNSLYSSNYIISNLSQDFHYMVHSHRNAWLVEPQTFCQTGRYCNVNADGTYDMTLTVYTVTSKVILLSLFLAILACLFIYSVLFCIRTYKK